jgi:hypothetical protein
MRSNVVRADMSKPFRLRTIVSNHRASVSNSYIREVEPLGASASRAQAPRCDAFGDWNNGINYIFDDEETMLTHRLPFDRLQIPR